MNTTYFKNVVMGNIFSTDESISIPEKYYIGLSSSAPHVDGTNVTEPSMDGTAYARVELTSLSEPANGVITNEQAINFNESATDWFVAGNPATHYVIYDAPTDGNLLMYNALKTERVIESNTIASIKESSLYIQLAD